MELVGDVEAVEDFLEDVGYGLVLEDAALGALGEEPDGWDEFESVSEEGVVAFALGESGDDAVEEAGFAAGDLDGDGGTLSEDLCEVDGCVEGRQEFDGEGEECGEGFGAVEADEEEIVVPQIPRLEPHRRIRLRVSVRHGRRPSGLRRAARCRILSYQPINRNRPSYGKPGCGGGA